MKRMSRIVIRTAYYSSSFEDESDLFERFRKVFMREVGDKHEYYALVDHVANLLHLTPMEIRNMEPNDLIGMMKKKSKPLRTSSRIGI